MTAVDERTEERRKQIKQAVRNTTGARARQQKSKQRKEREARQSGTAARGSSEVLQAMPGHQSSVLALGTIGLDIIGGVWTAWQFTSAVVTKKKMSKKVRRKVRRTAYVVLPLAAVAAFVPWAGLALSVTGYAASVRHRANERAHKARKAKLKRARKTHVNQMRRRRGLIGSALRGHQKAVRVRDHIRNGRRVRSYTRDNPHAR